MKKFLTLLMALCLSLALLAEEADKTKKVLLIKGEPNAGAIGAGTPFPSMAGRPDDLKPGPLPQRVRYKFTADEAVVSAAAILKTHLLSETLATGSLFGDSVIVQPGAWKWLQPYGSMGLKDSKPMDGLIPLGNKTVKLPGVFLQNQDEIATLEKTLREIIKSDGGGKVRALKSKEMDKWWTFIAFDIEEPTLVIETKKQKHLFIFSFTEKGVLVLDELNGLPR